MAGKPGRSGGTRPGAGRKPRSERFARPIAAAEKRIADRLPEVLSNQFVLALGGGERTEEEWAPAGTVMVDGFETETDEAGNVRKVVKVRKPAFPALPPDELVLVKRKVVGLGPDAPANQYLIDRILGKPAQSVEAEVTVLQKMAREVEKLTDAELLTLVGGDGDQEAAGTG